MTDLEITKLCAEAMGMYVVEWSKQSPGRFSSSMAASMYKGASFIDYAPLHDDAQAMALVKKLRLNIAPELEDTWSVWDYRATEAQATRKGLNRAICECVAKMQVAKVSA